MKYVRQIPRLRRVSMSPWVDLERGAREVGSDLIFSWKPNPAILGMVDWDLGRCRAQLEEGLEKTKGCVLEIIMKDLHHVRGEPSRMWEWVELAMRLARENPY